MSINLDYYEPTNPELWQGRKDSLPGERFFQRVHLVNLKKHSLEKNNDPVLLGFCSDEGIRRNLGRPGAQMGPDAIRSQLAKLACHQEIRLIDIGNISGFKAELEVAQQAFAQLIHHCQQENHFTIALGGGHDIAWPHFYGLAQHHSRLGIINFDAHFDMRPMLNHQGSSGTPFTQIQNYCTEHNLNFAYCCLGIQPVANTKSLFEAAQKANVTYLTIEQMQSNSIDWQINCLSKFIDQVDSLYVSICLDVFSDCFAPGVSAPQINGLTPWQALPLLKYIQQSGKVVSLDLAELSPPFDQEHKTARLAAYFLAEWLGNIN